MEEKKYTVMEFVEEFKKAERSDIEVNSLMKKINVLNYIPFSEKATFCKNILNIICLSEKGFVYNSPERYITYIMSTISLYTDLKIENEDVSLEYDALKSSGALDRILLTIGETDLKEFKNIWNMCFDDLILSQTSFPVLVKENTERFANIIGTGLETLADKLDELPLDVIFKKIVKK